MQQNGPPTFTQPSQGALYVKAEQYLLYVFDVPLADVSLTFIQKVGDWKSKLDKLLTEWKPPDIRPMNGRDLDRVCQSPSSV